MYTQSAMFDSRCGTLPLYQCRATQKYCEHADYCENIPPKVARLYCPYGRGSDTPDCQGVTSTLLRRQILIDQDIHWPRRRSMLVRAAPVFKPDLQLDSWSRIYRHQSPIHTSIQSDTYDSVAIDRDQHGIRSKHRLLVQG